MRQQTLILPALHLALASGLMISLLAGSADAQPHDNRYGQRNDQRYETGRPRDWGSEHWRQDNRHHGRGPNYYGRPDVYYSAPPVVHLPPQYYAPPRVQPGLSLNFGFPLYY